MWVIAKNYMSRRELDLEAMSSGLVTLAKFMAIL